VITIGTKDRNFQEAHENKLSCEKRRYEIYRMIDNEDIVKRSELAEYFNVTERTINNDIKALKERWGVEIICDSEYYEYKVIYGGELKELYEGYLYPNTKEDSKLKLKEKEVSLILASLVASRNFMPTEIGLIIEKLLRMLPEGEAVKLRKMHQLNERPILDERNIFLNIDKVRQAIAKEIKIKFRYKKGDGIGEYVITPYSFACELGKYYVIGKVPGKDELRHFRMDKIRSLDILYQVPGEKYQNFNINEYLQKSWLMFGGKETEVIVRFKDSVFDLVDERNMKCGQLLKRIKGSHFYYKFIVNGTIGIKVWLLGLGPEAQVIRPRELRKSIQKDIRLMSNLYGIKRG
jgi:predicted DNA-binding transcriptional regulator YafY